MERVSGPGTAEAAEKPLKRRNPGDKTDEESLAERYYSIVSERMQSSKGWRREMDGLGGGSLSDHVSSVFYSYGDLDPVKRMNEVEHAVRRQQEIQAEKRTRKKEKMREAVRGANKQLTEGSSGGKRDTVKEDKLFRTITDVIQDNPWSELNSFKTKEEAVGFIMECQPFSFTPLLDPSDEPLPKFETSHEALEYVLKMTPVPMSYMSTVSDFKRRLRIRFVDVEEDPDSMKKVVHSRSKRRNSALSTRATTTTFAAAQPQKPWVVDASGTFFESPTSLRGLRDVGTKYFIAVAQDLVQTVQQEGYRVQTRCSIPLSATPHEALAAWKLNNQRCNRMDNVKAVVLPVVIPPEIDVVAHRKQGFLVRVKELPPSCFRVKKAGQAGVAGIDAKGDAS